MAKKQDNLPEAERFMPLDPEDAALVFGLAPVVEFTNYLSPTDSYPGTADRIEVYRQRAARREPIFHPEDRKDLTGANTPPRKTKDPIALILANLKARL
jgi:hypothetical protein